MQRPVSPDPHPDVARPSRARVLGSLGVALVLGVALLALTGPASGLNTSHTGPRNARGFPTYFTDRSGLSLRLCEDGSIRCLGARPGDLVAPDGEALYWMAAATLPTRRGPLSVEFALEAAFGDRGGPVVFDRIRVRGHLSRAGRYVLLHPYGRLRFRAARPREQRNVDVTRDVPCSLRRGGRCPGRITNFLRSRRPPVSYVGLGERPTRVTGGRLRNSLVLRARGSGVIGRTRRFAVLGKVADGPAAALSRTAADFGNTSEPRVRVIVIRNLGNRQLRFRRVRVRGSDRIRVVRARSSCRRGDPVARGQRCRVTLRYRPGSERLARAVLTIADNTIAGVHRVPARARTTAQLSSRRRVFFTPRRAGSESPARRIVVENTGVRRLRIRRVAVGGRSAQSFERRSGAGPLCSSGMRLRRGRACAVYVAFAPKSFGRKTAHVVLRTSALSSPDRVLLRGRGR